jgi:hypothetical protein
MVLFTDHTATSGGFDCVPKFSLEWKDWGAKNPVDPSNTTLLQAGLVFVPPTDPIQQQVQHITGKAGILAFLFNLVFVSTCRFADYLGLEDASPKLSERR